MTIFLVVPVSNIAGSRKPIFSDIIYSNVYIYIYKYIHDVLYIFKRSMLHYYGVDWMYLL